MPGHNLIDQSIFIFFIRRNLEQSIFDVRLNVISADRLFGISPDLFPSFRKFFSSHRVYFGKIRINRKNFRRQFGTSNKKKMGLRIPPFAFTEYGVLMLASVLNSERAIQVNIQIVRIFSKMKEMILANREIIAKLTEIEHKFVGHDDNILLIFEYLKQLEQARRQEDKCIILPRLGEVGRGLKG